MNIAPKPPNFNVFRLSPTAVSGTARKKQTPSHHFNMEGVAQYAQNTSERLLIFFRMFLMQREKILPILFVCILCPLVADSANAGSVTIHTKAPTSDVIASDGENRESHTMLFDIDANASLVRSPVEQKKFESKVDWFHKAKYGLMYHFLADMPRFPEHPTWTSEKWSAYVDAVDVEKVAAQANEVGAGYVILSLGQNCRYYCAPNPVFEKYWEFEPYQYSSKRDLPMDLSKALEKYGIRMMLYMGTEKFFANPAPASLPDNEKWKRWEEAIQWYSDHYGKACSGWWLDAVGVPIPGEKNWPQRLHAAVTHGNPDAIVSAGGVLELSDYFHGHCNPDWNKQQQVLPKFGRWYPKFNIQWHAFQYLGNIWGAPGLAHSTESMVDYAGKVVKGGGVITFDVGTFDGSIPGPSMVIKEDQMTQLRAIRDALKDIPATDGDTMPKTTASAATSNHGRGNTFATPDNPDGTEWEMTAITIRGYNKQKFDNDVLKLWIFEGNADQWSKGDGDADGNMLNGTGITNTLLDEESFILSGTIDNNNYVQMDLDSAIRLKENTNYIFFLKYKQIDGRQDHFRLVQSNAANAKPNSNQLQIKTDANIKLKIANPLTHYVQGIPVP